jgi:hypothetical protein
MKNIWISICSLHKEKNENCDLCKKGYYVCNWKLKIENIFYKIFPRLWFHLKK